MRVLLVKLKRFAPEQPIWRLFVVLRRLQIWTGVNIVKRLWHEIRYRKILARTKKRHADRTRESLSCPPSPALRQTDLR